MDKDLARLYGVTTKRLNQQVGRNLERFPEDFMFQLGPEEAKRSRLQNATLNDNSHGYNAIRRGTNIKYMPMAFTEHGAIMAASVMNSPQAVMVSVYVVRAFVKLREMLSAHKQLAAKLDELERKLQDHDGQIQGLFDAIRQLMEPPPDPPRKPIGFASEMEGDESAQESVKTNGNNRRKLSARHAGRR